MDALVSLSTYIFLSLPISTYFTYPVPMVPWRFYPRRGIENRDTLGKLQTFKRKWLQVVMEGFIVLNRLMSLNFLNCDMCQQTVTFCMFQVSIWISQTLGTTSLSGLVSINFVDPLVVEGPMVRNIGIPCERNSCVGGLLQNSKPPSIH